MATLPTPSASTLPFRLKFRQLVLLDALGDSLSLRKAAALANLTQPAATRAMAELESAFGVQLFERSHRGMAPTVYGEALVRHARQVLFDVQRAHDEIQALRSGSHGFVRVGALLSSAVRVLPMAIGEVKRQFPRMRISVEQHPQLPLISKLREGSLDMVLCRLVTNSVDAEHLEQVVLFDDDFVLVAGRNHRLARTRSLTLADLVDEPWVLPHTSGPLYDHVRALFLTQVGRLPTNVVESTTSLVTNLMLIEHYGFLNFMQRSVAQTYTKRGVLRAMPISLGSPIGPHVVAVRRDTTHPPAVDALLQALKQVMAEPEPV
ncbi:LysR family transcriptional regulator [Hydrogenophaga sp. BPS33]|uniref:LysR family transcriptional regulator n=1 Tax=Hydrogenophaga sp. BPS33 TaxID=2651974 RepID=UPI00131FEDEB|nr:LysR family transcriptional regulator [Hydrogenophaga sp. BPS33]QHE84479.1 LysR family transcriptional regulator [Hydrogenophaga sp. BPS33]